MDLRPFSEVLSRNEIVHRVSLSGDQQMIWVANDADKQKVETLFIAWRKGQLEPVQKASPGGSTPENPVRVRLIHQLFYWLRACPVTLVLFLVSVLVFVVVMRFGDPRFYAMDWLSLLNLIPFEPAGGRIYFTSTLSGVLENHQYWRLFTPMFIHFSALHIIFNLLWLWELGRRIEIINGSFVLLLITLFASALSTLAEHVAVGPALIGGMSGVVFALLGHCFVWSRKRPWSSMGLPPGIYIFMFIYLAVAFTGSLDFLAGGAIANWAHLAGLLTGMVTGWLTAEFQKENSIL